VSFACTLLGADSAENSEQLPKPIQVQVLIGGLAGGWGAAAETVSGFKPACSTKYPIRNAQV